MGKAQEAMLARVSRTLARLETYPNGQLKQNAANRKILRQAQLELEPALERSGYYKGLAKVTGTLDKMALANDDYFNFIVDAFQPDKAYLADLEKQSIAEIETYLANEGLEVALKRPLMDMMSQNVGSGGSFNEMLAQVRQFIVGGRLEGKELEGTLLRYSRQITRDAMANFSSAYNQAIVSDTGLEFYKYVGGRVDRTREFCSERMGKYFHKREVEDWAKLSWQGKRRGTTKSSIFIYRGGYNCGHSLVAVDVSNVPKSVIERAKNKGYYKPVE